MKKLLLGAILVTALFSLKVTAQTKVKFEDGKTITLTGTSVGTYTDISPFKAGEVLQIMQTFYKMDGDTIEIAIYGELNNTFVDFNIYRVHKNQLNTYYFEIVEQIGENEKVLYYTLDFRSKDEKPEDKPIRHKYFPFGASNSEPVYDTVFSFSVYCDTKEGLEKLFNFVDLKPEGAE